MVEYNARVVLAYEVYRKILWFTENYDKEIGAVGTVKVRQEDGDKYFYVDNIYFPKQEVTGATVHFTAAMWGDLIKELPMEDLGRIGFYWHRHPSSSAHSSTDEEDTFETFMGKEANRKFFIFAQSAQNTAGINWEWRVDVRQPVRATIRDPQIEWTHEISEEDEVLAKECEAIIEKCIVKPAVAKTPTYNYHKPYTNVDAQAKLFDYRNGRVEEIDPRVGTHVLTKKGRETYDNDILDGFPTKLEEKAAVGFKDGAIHILAENLFRQVVSSALVRKGSGLYEHTRSYRWFDRKKDDELSKAILQPNAGKYDELCKAALDLFKTFNGVLLKRRKEENVKIEVKETAEKETQGYEVLGNTNVEILMSELDEATILDYRDELNICYAYDLNTAEYLGHVYISQTTDSAVIYGEKLIDMAVTIVPEEQMSGLEIAVADTTNDEKKEEEK